MRFQLLKAAIVIILLIATTLRLVGYIEEPPALWDEQTNTAVVEETKAKNSFLTLYYNGQPFYEKPPLWYSLNVFIAIPGVSTLVSMRIVNIFITIAILYITIGFVWIKFGVNAGIITWITLLLSHQLFERSPAGIFSSHNLLSADADSLQILFIVISFVAFISKHKSGQLIAGIATGLAFLTKGPFGFVPLIAFALLGKEVKKSFSISMLLIVPWYMYMIAQFGQAFVQSHFVYHLLYRAVFPLEGHGESPFYYALILLNPVIYSIFPLVLFSLFQFFRNHHPSLTLKFIGIILLLLFFIPSLMSTKIAWYILPIYPFLAMLTGITIGDSSKFFFKS